MRVAVVIPAHNEAGAIERTVAAAAGIPGVSQVIVADDGSTDATATKARAAGADVVSLPFNRGKGAALDAGVAQAPDADVVLLLDGDLGDTASQGESLLRPVIDGEADMAIAAFPRPTGKAGFGLVKRLARWGIRTMGGDFDATAPLSGQRALTRPCLEAVTPFASGYGVEVAVTVRALRAGMRLTEVQTTMTHAATGRDLAGFVHRGKQFLHVARALVALALQGTRR